MAREDMLVPAAKMGTDRRGGHSPGQEIGLTEPRSICRTIAVSLRRVWGYFALATFETFRRRLRNLFIAADKKRSVRRQNNANDPARNIEIDHPEL
jgi:hypothetical protein